ncbi:DUF6848 family protein [Deinococcus cellulosilyticus]|uniref:DUF6848 domain-containing protein n=1 Tax=Deinococcus cellulosilyticus (strain DSM 18568 / NBRC 106333 / KACC 11606 / 5516J-15) TaxID=1223518 RepID=A0A511NB26_DEIC1|nr:hypothetical protein [Deinococcus cellulosilyticus]GEM50029.1 hypothetical protein DC3_56640 [Deinococcus cellulosilyticus NBRC 106333 = KACC 11606]
MLKTTVIQINDDTNDTTHEFTFREPTTPVVSRYFSMAGKNLPKASHEFCNDTIVPEQKDQWLNVLQTKPGYAVQAANRMLDLLGYGAETKKIERPTGSNKESA